MTTTTQCPACGTRFKATQAQLEAYHGMVRCGHCHAAFDAIENRTSSESSPQLNLPIVLEDFTPLLETPDAADTIDLTEALPADNPAVHASHTARETAPGKEQIWRPTPETKEPRRTWPWSVASSLLLAVLLAQAVYLFRVELAARLPGLKPALVAACARLHCEVPLPRNIELISIESSNLETDPSQPGIITLSITLRNMASYVQAYPNLELTLTDFNDSPVGRRLLRPGEYLKDAADEKTGLAANRENSIRLAIDASSLKAAGYRLFLAY
ncbi:MAG TPA: zinc-ribbon and DUF3426 domain-containing protein [Gallionellaceae bacterium]